MPDEKLNIQKSFWRQDEIEGLLPYVDDAFIKKHPDLIARTWWGLLLIGREDLILKTGAQAFNTKEEIEKSRTKGQPYNYSQIPSPINRYHPIIGELVYMFQNIRSRYEDYSIDRYMLFMRKALTLATLGFYNLTPEDTLPIEAIDWIENCVNDLTPRALAADQARIEIGGIPIDF